jgi:hypothetical protein
MMKYQVMNAAEAPMMSSLAQSGQPVSRVTKLSGSPPQ